MRLGLVLAVAIAGCGSPDVSAPDRPSDYSGQITAVEPFQPITENCVEPGDQLPDEPVSSDDPLPFCTDPDVTTLGTILVEETPGVQQGDKIYLRIEPETSLHGGPDGATPLDFDDLVVGDTVDVWVDGPVADSYPQQGVAQAVVIRSS